MRFYHTLGPISHRSSIRSYFTENSHRNQFIYVSKTKSESQLPAQRTPAMAQHFRQNSQQTSTTTPETVNKESLVSHMISRRWEVRPLVKESSTHTAQHTTTEMCLTSALLQPWATSCSVQTRQSLHIANLVTMPTEWSHGTYIT